MFPRFCLGCEKEGELLCSKCRDTLSISPRKICPICKLSDQSRNCPGSHLDNLWTLSSYKDNLIGESVRKIKYEYLVELIDAVWSDALKKIWQSVQEETSRDALLIPVPLHRKRYLERGFNQSAIIAETLSDVSGLAVNVDLIYRFKYNEPQVGLSGMRRQENIKGIFRVNYRALSDAWGKELILVDDVYTTGSTLQECARTLQSAGFKHISGLVLAVD